MFELSPIEVPDLSGRTFLVTGAGRGIGSVAAELLASKGARVYAGVPEDPEPSRGARLEKASVLRLDVTRQLDVEHAISRIRDEAGRLDGLVNNAGVVTPIGRAEDISSDSLRSAFDVNVIGVHRMIRAAMPMLRASGGVVVNAGTGAATTAMEGWAAYCGSKAAARMMTRVFALELADSGVQFFFLGIPPTDTAMQAEIRESGLNPVSRIDKSDLAGPEVPASVMAWLCGPAARDLGDVMLDVRDELFSKMMGPPSPDDPARPG